MNKLKESIKNNDKLTPGEKVELMRIANFIFSQSSYIIKDSYYDENEKLEHFNVLYKMSKVIENFTEIEPFMNELCHKKYKEEKFGTKETKIKYLEEMEK